MAVEDSNDNIPYFTNTVYDATAYETFSVGASVVQVTALDKDNGINGQLTYTIEAGAVQFARHLLSFLSVCVLVLETVWLSVFFCVHL